MSTSPLPALAELAPIARRLRDREEEISAGKADMIANIGRLVGLAAEQGRDLLLAKTKLGRALKWSEWLRAQVPNLPETQAAKYERVATEQLTDARQAVFAFLPAPEHEATPDRAKPRPWEYACGWAMRLNRVATHAPIDKWPSAQQDVIREQLRPIVTALGGSI